MYVEGPKHNLISISKLCDKGHKVVFELGHCLICDEKTRNVILVRKRVNNIYLLDLHHASYNIQCFLTEKDNIWSWHQKLCHIHMDHLNWLNKKQMIEGLPKLTYMKDKIYKACKK